MSSVDYKSWIYTSIIVYLHITIAIEDIKKYFLSKSNFYHHFDIYLNLL